MTSTSSTANSATAPRWNGTRGRMEVWYATCTEEDGTGWWFHYETVAPVGDGGGDPFAHGWVACFPVGADPILERFGPVPARPTAAGGLVTVGECRIDATTLTGHAGRLVWDLELFSDDEALYTFPRWAWEREVLPGAQLLDRPAATISGRVRVDGVERELLATGAGAHIFSHGSAKRWSWLHCDLGGGDTLEVVAAVSHMPVLERLAPLPFARLRLGSRDRPRDPLATAIRARCEVALPTWHLRVGLGARRRLRATVELPPERCVQLEYPNPDGTRAYCVNSERADARIAVEQRVGGRWSIDREWRLDATAHAEVGRTTPWEGIVVSSFAG
ncbi:MAG: hypothetical protein U0U69_00680 [Acidimicrobiia bacterium]